MKNLLNKYNYAWLILIAISYAVIFYLIRIGVINAYYQITLISIGINIILALSLNLIIGVCGQFSLGHAGFMCIGAYSSAIILKMMPNIWGLLLGMLVGAIISSIAALIIALPTLRLRGDYLAIATLGFSEIIRIIVLNMKITNGAAGINNIPKLTDFTIVFIVLVVTLIVIINFTRSAPGRACISIREDEIASEAMGVNTTKYKTIAFVIGAIIASVAGTLYASYYYTIKPDTFNFNKSIDILVIVVFGGMGSMTGSVLSGTLLGLINFFLQSFAELRMILYSIIIILIMVFRPSGLLGTKEFTFSGLFRFFKKIKEKNYDKRIKN